MDANEYLRGLGQAGDLAEQTIRDLGGGQVLTEAYYFQYQYIFTNIPFGQSQTRTNSVEVGSYFLCTELALSARFNAATTPTGLAARAKLLRNVTTLPGTPAILADIGYVKVNLTQSNRPWFQAPLWADICTGDPSAPMLLPKPIVVSGNTQINATLTNDLPALTGAATPAIDAMMTLGGIWVDNKGRG